MSIKAIDAYLEAVKGICRQILDVSGARFALSGLQGELSKALHPKLTEWEDVAETNGTTLDLSWDRTDRNGRKLGVYGLGVTALPATQDIVIEGTTVLVIPKAVWNGTDGNSILRSIMRHSFHNPQKA